MTYMEVRILISKAYGYSFSAMFPCPGIDMGKLQQVVAHASAVVSEDHISPFSFFITSRGRRSTRPVALSKRMLYSS